MNTIKVLIPSQLLSSSAATYYTTPANTKSAIKRLTVCNPTGTARAVTIYLIASGGTAGASNTITYQRVVAAGATEIIWEAEGHALEVGGFIQALADSASQVSIRATGVEFSA